MDLEMLVNKENLLSRDYIPTDMVVINEPTGSKIDKTYVNQLNKETYLQFKKMQLAAKENGFEIFIDSSYRSYEYQERVFNATVLEKGLDHALKYVAPPGGSEHQTGLAFDVIFRRNGEMIEEQNETDPEIKWLFANAYKYGFILRYPKGKEDITGYNFEPWHFRYVGLELAKEITEENLTLEEYHKNKQHIK